MTLILYRKERTASLFPLLRGFGAGAGQQKEMQPMSNGKNTQNFAAESEQTIDLLELFQVLLRKGWALVLAFVIGASAAGICTKLFITPQYKATSMIYVYSKSTSITSLADLQIGSQLAVDFQIVATTREVMESVIEAVGLDATYTQLLNTVSISNPSNSHILQIDVKNPDPKLAADISNALADELRARIAAVMNTDEPSMVSRATVPTAPVSPSLAKNALLGGLLLSILLAGVFVVAYLLDDTIKSEEDVRNYLGLNVLGEVSSEDAMKKKGARGA